MARELVKFECPKCGTKTKQFPSAVVYHNCPKVNREVQFKQIP